MQWVQLGAALAAILGQKRGWGLAQWESQLQEGVCVAVLSGLWTLDLDLDSRLLTLDSGFPLWLSQWSVCVRLSV
jgi:hypothetical protein